GVHALRPPQLEEAPAERVVSEARVDRRAAALARHGDGDVRDVPAEPGEVDGAPLDRGLGELVERLADREHVEAPRGVRRRDAHAAPWALRAASRNARA